jgi:hypothetical protein
MASKWLLESGGFSGSGATPTAVATPVPTRVQQKQTPVQTQSQGVTAKPGENKIFSGGLLNKAFDVLRLPEYAGTGYLQGATQYAKSKGLLKAAPFTNPVEFGKSMIAGIKNIPKSVQERREFGREAGQYNVAEDLGVKNKYAQSAVNLAGSLAMPSLAVGKILPKIPGVSAITSKVGGVVNKGVEMARNIEPIAKVVEKVDPFFRRPELAKLVSQVEETIGTRQSKIINQVLESAQNLTPLEQARVGRVLEGSITADPKLAKIAEPLRELTEQIGKEALDRGLISPETWEKMRGKYMTHIWNVMRKEGTSIPMSSAIIPRGGEQFFKKRKGAEGFIKEFAPAMIKGLGTEVKSIEQANLYKKIAETYGKKAGEFLEAGEAYAPAAILNSRAGKVLQGIALPKDVVDIMERTMTVNKKGLVDKAYDLWKKGKTIYNVPGYHVRNLLSNQILSDMSTEQGIPKTLFNYGKAVSQYKGKGDQSFVNAAKSVGLIGRKNIGAGFQEALDVSGYGSKVNPLQKVDRALTGFQNASEETSKLNVFTAWMNKLAKDAGKSIQEALKDETILKAAKDKAEEAIFSPYRIGKTERGIMSKVTPFYSFARQAIPFTAKTALNRPGTLTKYEKAKTAVEGLTPERKGEPIPDYAKGQIRTPFKDKEGRSYYFNPQFIYPWGNIDNAGGDISKGQLPFGLSLPPTLTIPAEAITNKQLYTGKPITSSKSKSKQREDYINWFLRSVGPTAISSAQKAKAALTGEQDYAGRKRNIPATLLDIAGLKTASFVPEEQKKYQKQNIIYQIRDINSEIKKWKKSNDPKKQKYIDELIQQRRELLQAK